MQNTYVALFIDHVQIIEKLLSARDFSGHGETTNIRRFPVTCHFHVTTPTTKQLMTSTFLVQHHHHHHHHHHPPSVQTRYMNTAMTLATRMTGWMKTFPNNMLVKDEEVSWDSEMTRPLAGMSFLFLFVLFTY
jgi:hypothetical protein